MAAKLQARQFHFAPGIHGEGAGEVIMKSREKLVTVVARAKRSLPVCIAPVD